MNLPRIFAKLTSLVLAILLCALPMGSAQARPAALVCISNGSLQSAINDAVDGQTLYLCSVTFTETLTINKNNLTLTSTSRDTTILQPAVATNRVIKVASGKNLTLRNLQITGGHPVSSVGGGILMDGPDGGNLTLDTVRIQNNSADYGGGVFQEGVANTLTATNSIFNNNTSNTQTGGAIYVKGNAVLTGNTFLQNNAGSHGGAVHVDAGYTTVTGGLFQENHATLNGGGLNVNNGLTINGTTFTANSAGNSGGALVQWNFGTTVDIQNATFTSNTAKVKGGAAYVGSYFTLTRSTFTSNIVDSGDTRDTAGGGVYANDGVNASQVTFTQNTATCPPYNYGAGCLSHVGGGMAINRRVAGGNSIVTQSTFDGNRSWHGSGIYSNTGVQLFVASSKFINNGQNCWIYSVYLCGYGSGIDATWLDGNNLTFENNYASNEGGAISASTLSLANSKFINNTAAAPGGGGGAILAQVAIGINLLFSQNVGTQGAAIKIEATLPVISSIFKHITIANPTRQTGPAIYVSAGGALTLQNSIISAYTKGCEVLGSGATLGSLTEDYNLFSNNGTNITNSGGTVGSGGHSLTAADPFFVNPAGGDYHLQKTSPAIGKGTNLGVTRDLDGKPRFAHWDSGAYQYVLSTFLPTVLK